MSEFSPGDRVRTTARWTTTYTNRNLPLEGMLVAIRQPGETNPANPERTHVVRLDEPFHSWQYLTFDPRHLVLVQSARPTLNPREVELTKLVAEVEARIEPLITDVREGGSRDVLSRELVGILQEIRKVTGGRARGSDGGTGNG